MRRIDHSGRRKGKLTALRKDETKRSHWICQCECGNLKSIRFSATGARSCGCSLRPPKEKYHEQVKIRIKRDTTIDSNGCWNYNLNRDKAGYGMSSYRRQRLRIHRVSWIVFRGEIPKNSCVLHHCDNKSCCNPDHLFLGSHKENSEDMVKKNRNAHGSRAGSAKLIEIDVMNIRKFYNAGLYTQKELSIIYDIRQTKISEIVNLKSWKRVKHKDFYEPAPDREDISGNPIEMG